MKLSTYLYFAGNCEEALAFYEKVAGGKLLFSMPFGGSPAEGMMPPGWEDKILHASTELGGQVIMASDAPQSQAERWLDSQSHSRRRVWTRQRGSLRH